MKKIPTLFERQFENHKVSGISDKVTPGLDWVLRGIGIPTVKMDGACCAIINGELYKRYDAKKGRKPPEGAILCQEEADPITGHWPCWIKCNRANPDDKWFWAAYDNRVRIINDTSDGTYEAIGKHFNGNPYDLDHDRLVKHGSVPINEALNSFNAIKAYLTETYIEGIVWWLDGEPKCKIKRTDFGLKWGKVRLNK